MRLAPGKKRRRYGPVRRVVEATSLRAIPDAHREWKKRRKAARGKRGTPEPMAEARRGIAAARWELQQRRLNTRMVAPAARDHKRWLKRQGRRVTKDLDRDIRCAETLLPEIDRLEFELNVAEYAPVAYDPMADRVPPAKPKRATKPKRTKRRTKKRRA